MHSLDSLILRFNELLLLPDVILRILKQHSERLIISKDQAKQQSSTFFLSLDRA